VGGGVELDEPVPDGVVECLAQRGADPVHRRWSDRPYTGHTHPRHRVVAAPGGPDGRVAVGDRGEHGLDVDDPQSLDRDVPEVRFEVAGDVNAMRPPRVRGQTSAAGQPVVEVSAERHGDAGEPGIDSAGHHLRIRQWPAPLDLPEQGSDLHGGVVVVTSHVEQRLGPAKVDSGRFSAGEPGPA
jgi:hypothetical protein